MQESDNELELNYPSSTTHFGMSLLNEQRHEKSHFCIFKIEGAD